MVRLIAVGIIWFQIRGAAEEKARRPKSVFSGKEHKAFRLQFYTKKLRL